MGEYAKFNGESIKIGTCEDMYYLRWDHAHLVTPQYGNVDPVRDREALRFRFPWPDEDHVDPGAFNGDFERGFPLHGFRAPAGVEHGSVQFTARPGYLLSLPCPEGAGTEDDRLGVTVAGLRVARNGFSGHVQLVQQRWWQGRLVAVFRCGACGAKWRVETLADVEPYVVAIRAEADRRAKDSPDAAAFAHAVADRILAGYTAAPSVPVPFPAPVVEPTPLADHGAGRVTAAAPVPAARRRLERGEETVAVRRALRAAGIRARVRHGRGTAWGWLDIAIADELGVDSHAVQRRAIEIAQEVTGRSGEYDGRISTSVGR